MSIRVIRETHETPEWAARILERAAGTNLRGDPLYRLIWGWNRLTWVGGKWTDRDPNTKALIREVIELRQVPRYSHLGVNKWYVERYYPPEHFGNRRAWEAQTLERPDGISIPSLGPYPSRGDYDHFYTMEGPDGKFRQLTRGRVEWIASIIEDSEIAHRKKEFDRRELEADLTASQLHEKRHEEEKPDAEDLQVLRDQQKPFGNEPMVTVL